LRALLDAAGCAHLSVCAGTFADCAPPDELYKLFQVDLPAADVLVLLDASGSMRAHGYNDVRQAIVDFAPNLTDKETLHLRVFETLMRTEHRESRAQAQRMRQEAESARQELTNIN
jgi:hypothetical protein